MKTAPKVLVVVLATIAITLGTLAWRKHHPSPEVAAAVVGPPLTDDEIVNRAITSAVPRAGREVVQQCGGALGNKSFDVTLTFSTVVGAIQIETVKVVEAEFGAEDRACIERVFKGQLMPEPQVPADRQYEVDARVTLPPASVGYNR